MKNTNIFAADFETSVYKGQKKTEVWSSALCPIRTPEMLKRSDVSDPDYGDVIIHHSIDESVQWLESQDRDMILYYHNLKFDGSFWCAWMLAHGYVYYAKQKKHDDEKPGTFSCLISQHGQWYNVRIVLKNGHVISLRDSLKIIPFSLKKAGHDFQTKHQKLEMEYTGKRYPGCRISPDERKYIANDVLVLAELIEIMYRENVITTKTLTIGSACMEKYKSMVPGMYWEENFWRLDKVPLPDYIEGKNADDYIRKSYRGGWCYAKDDRTGVVYDTLHCRSYQKDGSVYIGLTADVNSLYPSMMHSMSGNYYPVGKPHFVKGKSILKWKLNQYYSFIHLKCRFRIKPGFLPFLQIKGNPFYKGTEMLKDSKPTYKGEKYEHFTMADGTEISDIVELTLTCTDYELLHKHYQVEDEIILDGCWFYTDIGMFDEYINYWAEIKQHSHGSRRTIAKLFLNNLYGKFSTSPINISKIPVLDDDILCLDDDIEPDKKTVYIPIGSAITSYARRFTITAAQKNYSSFCYADTDSIHCLISREDIKGIKVHPTEFCCWKLESFWKSAIFVRQKTYIEVVNYEDEQPIPQAYYNVKCAGMPQSCKDMLIHSFQETRNQPAGYRFMAKLIRKQSGDTLKKDQLVETYDFLGKQRTIADFTHGLVIPGKLMPVRIPGGVLLTDTTFSMK